MKRHRDSEKVVGAEHVKSCRVRTGVNVMSKQKWGNQNHE